MAEGFIDRMLERMSRFTDSKMVFGDPVERDGLTVIPVSKLCVKFCGRSKGGDDKAGGAGVIRHKPIGYVEIKGGKQRFRPVQDPDHMTLALLGSSLLLFLTIRTVLKNGTQMNQSLLDAMKRITQGITPPAAPKP